MRDEQTEDASYEDDEDLKEVPETASDPAHMDAPSPPPAALTGIDLDLTVRCGHLSLSLGALQHLAPGSVLDVSGITPGRATLCHGERIVAHGELVDVDGRLGLQITRMVFDR